MITLRIEHKRFLEKLKQIISSERRPLIIGIDGRDGSGKTSIARWVCWENSSWTLVSLDDHLMGRIDDRLYWNTDVIKNIIEKSINLNRTVIVEGICLLDAFDKLKIEGIELDFYTYVRRRSAKNWSNSSIIVDYFTRKFDKVRSYAKDCSLLGG